MSNLLLHFSNFLQIQWGHTGQTSARSLYPDLLGSAVALRRQRPDVGIVSGANDFNRLSGYIRSRSQPGKHREREEVGFVVILLPARKTSGTSPPRGVTSLRASRLAPPSGDYSSPRPTDGRAVLTLGSVDVRNHARVRTLCEGRQLQPNRTTLTREPAVSEGHGRGSSFKTVQQNGEENHAYLARTRPGSPCIAGRRACYRRTTCFHHLRVERPTTI
jgi:hypothetical protein